MGAERAVSSAGPRAPRGAGPARADGEGQNRRGVAKREVIAKAVEQFKTRLTTEINETGTPSPAGDRK